MKQIKLISTVLFLLIAFSINAIAQQKDANDPALIAKVTNDLNEVYGDYANIYVTPKNIAFYSDAYARMEIKKEPIKAGENYLLLSKIRMVDKYNYNLQQDNSTTFKPETFNPFKYFFNFESKTVEKCRVDNTNYIIIFNPKK